MIALKGLFRRRSRGSGQRVLVNGFGAYAGGIVRVHNELCRELSKKNLLDVANAPRDQDLSTGARILSSQSDSRLRSALGDAVASLRFDRYDVRIDSAPGLRFFTRARKHIVIVHDLNFLEPSVHNISRIQLVYRSTLHRWTLKRCDGVVAVSRSTCRELASFAPHAASKTRVLRLPVTHLMPSANSQRDDTLSAERRDDHGRLTNLLSFGHAANKGVEHLLALLSKRADLSLSVVCSEAQWTEFWKASCNSLGVGDRVVVLSGLSDQALIEEYRRADVFCMVSSYEGYGLPAAEALSLARPTIVSAIPTLTDTARGHAVAVDPGDVTALSEAVDEALSAPLARWTDAARDFENWTWDKWANELVDGNTHA